MSKIPQVKLPRKRKKQYIKHVDRHSYIANTILGQLLVIRSPTKHKKLRKYPKKFKVICGKLIVETYW